MFFIVCNVTGRTVNLLTTDARLKLTANSQSYLPVFQRVTYAFPSMV